MRSSTEGKITNEMKFMKLQIDYENWINNKLDSQI